MGDARDGVNHGREMRVRVAQLGTSARLGVAIAGFSINNGFAKMPSLNPDDKLLLIRCPTCGQRFKVGEDLRGRTVECGGCERRFKINDEVIVRGQKFYPGERSDGALSRFQRVPLAMAPDPSGIQSIRYVDPPDPTEFEPVAPQRIIAGAAGVCMMVMVALLLMFGASRGGALDGMTTDKRLLMAGFTGLLGTVMLVYANPRTPVKSGGMGVLLGAGLLALPFFFTEGSVPLSELALAKVPPAKKQEETVRGESESVTRLRALIGTVPLETEIARLAREGSSKHAVGLWLKGLREQNRYLVRDYILRVTGANPPLILYPRGGDFLMVVSGISKSLDEVAGLVSVLGTLEKVYPEIQVLEISVNNESFVTGSIDKLTDKQGSEFYMLNKKELESIDLDRVQRAVQRLAEVKPTVFRSDISNKLLSLLEAPGVAFKGDICRALAVWSTEPGPAGNAALKEVNELIARKAKVPPEMIKLIVKEKNLAVVPVLDELWAGSPTQWESIYGEVGPPVEALLLRRFPDTDGMLRQSAVRLLGVVGRKDSLPVLEAAIKGADSELRVLLEKSIASIRKRPGP